MSRDGKIGLALMVLIVCSLACGSGDVRPDTPMPMVTVYVVPTLEPTEIPIDIPTDIPAATPGVTRRDIFVVYGESVVDVMNDWAIGMSRFSELFGAAGADIRLLDDPEWLGSVYGTMDLLTAASMRFRVLVPPEEFVPSHEALLNAANHIDIAIGLFRPGIANKDIRDIGGAGEQMRLGTEDINKASMLLDEIGF